MGMKPVKQPSHGRIIESVHRRIAALERRQGVGNSSLIDLDDYLHKPNPTGVGSAYSEWTPVQYLGDPAPFAAFYVANGRCWLAGAVQWFGASDAQTTTLLDTALPETCRPTYLTNVTFDLDFETGTWAPVPSGNASDAQSGARIQADVLTDGTISLENFVSNYQGRAIKTGGGIYLGMPSQGVLILNGISWLVDQ